MTRRNESERDFPLKSAIRSILWSQGYSTKLDVLLAYDRDIQGRSVKAGLTDLDVLGVRLDPGFRVHTAVADCKTTAGQVPERLFWLSGVGKFFESDTNLLVRSQPVPDHAITLARSLDISLVGPDDLTILTNIYINSSNKFLSSIWQKFFSQELLGETLSLQSRLPSTLKDVERYRETGYWMDEPYRQLLQIIVALQHMAKDNSSGDIFKLVFADFVWLYVLALWRTCQALNAGGLSKLERGLELYISGNESGWKDLQRVKKSLEALARKSNLNVSLSIAPPFIGELTEVVARCVRRPKPVAQLARRAEWLTVGQLVGRLGPPPWSYEDDDLITDKLLGDIVTFLVRASGLKASFSDFYLSLLQDSTRVQERPNTTSEAMNITELQMQDSRDSTEDLAIEQTELPEA